MDPRVDHHGGSGRADCEGKGCLMGGNVEREHQLVWVVGRELEMGY